MEKDWLNKKWELSFNGNWWQKTWTRLMFIGIMLSPIWIMVLIFIILSNL